MCWSIPFLFNNKMVFDDFLLQENGDFLFLETGDKIILDHSIPAPPVVVTPTVRRGGWFAIPEMRKKLLPQTKERIFLSEIMDEVRR